MRSAKLAHQFEIQLLEALRKSALEDLCFFSNGGRAVREQWIVSEFLTCQNLRFAEGELHSPDQNSKTDVEFRDAKFQIKEILDPDVRRHNEVKVRYQRLLAANRLHEIKWPSFCYDVPPITTIYSLVAAEAYSLSAMSKYASLRSDLDLLFYVTRTRASLIKRDEIDREYLASTGWRSISCLAGKQALVLFASKNAPAFLGSLQNSY